MNRGPSFQARRPGGGLSVEAASAPARARSGPIATRTAARDWAREEAPLVVGQRPAATETSAPRPRRPLRRSARQLWARSATSTRRTGRQKAQSPRRETEVPLPGRRRLEPQSASPQFAPSAAHIAEQDRRWCLAPRLAANQEREHEPRGERDSNRRERIFPNGGAQIIRGFSEIFIAGDQFAPSAIEV